MRSQTQSMPAGKGSADSHQAASVLRRAGAVSSDGVAAAPWSDRLEQLQGEVLAIGTVVQLADAALEGDNGRARPNDVQAALCDLQRRLSDVAEQLELLSGEIREAEVQPQSVAP